jgi:hypothetical protein
MMALLFFSGRIPKKAFEDWLRVLPAMGYFGEPAAVGRPIDTIALYSKRGSRATLSYQCSNKKIHPGGILEILSGGDYRWDLRTKN